MHDCKIKDNRRYMYMVREKVRERESEPDLHGEKYSMNIIKRFFFQLHSKQTDEIEVWVLKAICA